MSTTGVETWAVDLADVGAIYPFQGLETLFVLICVAGWLWWHVWCIRWEKRYHAEKIARYAEAGNFEKAINSD